MPAMLIYSATMSLDGYVADEAGNFDWSAPDQEVHAFINDMVRPIGTYLFGRRMYETMLYWENPPNIADEPAVVEDFAEIWKAASKVVYSRTLQAVSSANTRLERVFDPKGVRRIKETAGHDMCVGGSDLAGQAFNAGLVDECHLFITPIIVGGGKPALAKGLRLELELLDERRFSNGVVHLHHRVRR